MKKNGIIGIDANEANLIPNRVGSNQFAYGLLKAIEKIDKDNNYLIYLSTPLLSDMPKTRENWGYRIIPPPKFWTQWRLPIDLFTHFPRPSVFFSISHYTPRFSPVPRVVTITDLGYLKYPNQLRKKDYYQLKFWTADSIKSANHIIAISEFTKRDILSNYNVPEQKISVVYPGYEKEIFNTNVGKKESQLTLKKHKIDAPYILFLGALKPSKNIERLVQAFSILKDKNLKLVISGKKGWLFESIFNVVRELSLSDRVIFTDYVEDREVPILMANAEVFALPSLYEGFGMPVVECMACGTPVVVSKEGSLPEVVKDAGVIVDPYDTNSIAKGIEKAIKNRSEFSKKGLLRAKDFDWDESAKRTIDILSGYLK